LGLSAFAARPRQRNSPLSHLLAWSASPLSRLHSRIVIYHGSAVSAGLPTNEGPGFMLISIGLTKSSWICSDFLRDRLTYTVTAQASANRDRPDPWSLCLVAWCCPSCCFIQRHSLAERFWSAARANWLNFRSGDHDLVLWAHWWLPGSAILTLDGKRGLECWSTGSAIYNGMRIFIQLGRSLDPRCVFDAHQLAGWTSGATHFGPVKKPPPLEAIR